MKQNKWVILLLLLILFAVATVGYTLNERINTLSDQIQGVYNNEDFSDAIQSISASVYMIIKIPADQEDQSSMSNIYVDDTGQVWGKGTGFAVTEDGWLVTAKHVIDDASQLYALTFDSEGKEKRYRVIYNAIHKDHDLGVVKIQTDTTPLDFTDSNKLLDVGYKVGFIGFPSAEEPYAKIVHDGIISHAKFRGPAGELLPEYKIHAFVNKGHSGGPVFLADSGEVIGFISARKKASNLPQIDKKTPPISQDTIDNLLESKEETVKLLGFVLQNQNLMSDQQNQMYNLLSTEISTKTQMGVGIVVGLNQGVMNHIVRIAREDMDKQKLAAK